MLPAFASMVPVLVNVPPDTFRLDPVPEAAMTPALVNGPATDTVAELMATFCPAAMFPDRWPPLEVKLKLEAPVPVKLRLAPLMAMGVPEVVPASWLNVPWAPREPAWTVKVPWLAMVPLAPLVTVPPLRSKAPAVPICRVWVPVAPPMVRAATWVLVLSVTV